jgi:hypothetical protein
MNKRLPFFLALVAMAAAPTLRAEWGVVEPTNRGVSKPNPDELSVAGEEGEQEEREAKTGSVGQAGALAPTEVQPDGSIPTAGYLPIAGDTDTVVNSTAAVKTSTTTAAK